jgi:hypothetical protein
MAPAARAARPSEPLLVGSRAPYRRRLLAPPRAAALDAPPPPLFHNLPPTRLEREAASAVGIDVEFATLAPPPPARRLQVPVEVAVVAAGGAVLLHSALDPVAGTPLEAGGWRAVGGVPPRAWRGAAPPLAEARATLAALLAGRVVVGHNLPKDLGALGLDLAAVPAALRRDTMRFATLQGGRGRGRHGRALAALAAERLGRAIQVRAGGRGRGARHDPAEDAAAALDLYLECCHYDRARMSFEDLVEAEAAALLRGGGAGGGGAGGGESGGREESAAAAAAAIGHWWGGKEV